MKFVECNVNDLSKRRPYGHIYEFIKAFDDSGLDCVMVVDHHYTSAKSCADSLNQTIKRYKLTAIKAFTRNDEVFLIRKNKCKFSQ